ncbi:hypothetical protein BD779DRAFT_1466017 [Infundibulicybe gibba]|nr:hypothetical protein BD779DRAFT_1466017 [Infundibulicybe gibba]
MSDDELVMLKSLIETNPGLEVTPQILLGFIAEKTKHSPPRSPLTSDDVDLPGMARSKIMISRAIPPVMILVALPIGLARVAVPKAPSPFDTERRQRSTPLHVAPPSSWAKRPPAHRRKSDAGSRSDSESTSPGAFSRSRGPSRSRAPSNPTSPSLESSTFSPVGSPPFGGAASRPHSRARSQPQSHFHNMGYQFGSPGDDRDYALPGEDDTVSDFRGQQGSEKFMQSLSSLPMPKSSPDSDSEEEEESVLGLVMDRSTTSSTTSLEPQDRLDVLQRANTELGRKLMEAERTLQNRLSEHESDLEEMQGRLEEMRSELSATKREEKELRSKERQNITQIAALEGEVAKFTKALELARSTYNSLQRQYQEQCAASEKYRDDLRQREELIRNLREAASLHEVEGFKWIKEHEGYEHRISQLEAELAVAQQAHAQLDEQKQENLLLKETIDRMRFDMDEMRNSATANLVGSGQSSAANTISKSLGAELLGKMGDTWGMEDEDEEVEEENSVEEDDTEGEDFIQTIITRKTRKKIPSRANKIETQTFEEIKEYPIAQHNTIQTDEPAVNVFAVQTDPEPTPLPRVTVEIEIQTDEIEPEISRSPSPQNDESLASSSSTIIPPTPKAQSQLLDHLHPVPIDQPPAYNQINPHEQEEHTPEPLPGGISEGAIEDWKALKDELGLECMVIDKIVESSDKNSSRSSKRFPRRGRFYNIYNTYVYGDKTTPSSSLGVAGQIALYTGAAAIALLAISPFMPYMVYTIPGAANYYDRAAWNSFNTMQPAGEGFAPGGTAAVWTVLGRMGGGAARFARGWPT